MRVYNWLHFIRSVPFPDHCTLCSRALDAGIDFCSDCLGELPFNEQACPCCALPVSGADGLLCGSCLRQTPPYTASYVPLLYQPPVSNLIGEFKFRNKLHMAGPLSRLFCEQLPPGFGLPDLILPVPLHPSRLRERGFNQALELARGVAATLDLKLDWRGCRRIRATQPQIGLDESERRKNLRAAFVANSDLAGRHVALFDDVVTTGTTVAAASLALRRAGAARVDIWALARTPNRP